MRQATCLEQLLSPKTRQRAALCLGYDKLQDLARHASAPAVRKAATEAMRFFPERRADTAALLGEAAPEVWQTAADVLLALGVKPHTLFAHPNRLVALRAAHYVLGRLETDRPQEKQAFLEALDALDATTDVEILSVAFDAIAHRSDLPAFAARVGQVLERHAYHLPRSGLALIRQIANLPSAEGVAVLAKIASTPTEAGSVAMARLEEIARTHGPEGEEARRALAKLRGG